MLYYDKSIHEKLLEYCRSKTAEGVIHTLENQIISYSALSDIDSKAVEQQVRLHLANFNLSLVYDPDVVWIAIESVLDKRFGTYKKQFDEYCLKCGADLLPERNSGEEKTDYENNATLVRKGDKLFIRYKKSVLAQVLVKDVDTRDGEFIESNLHYLRAFRQDCHIRKGLYFEGYDLPICYMSFALVDRQAKIHALNDSLSLDDGNGEDVLSVSDDKIIGEEVVELARVFGCGKLPHNVISSMTAQCAKDLRAKGLKYIITASNPYLGFTGKSIIGSGFVPYAVRPVNYRYDNNGVFTTFRQSPHSPYTNNNLHKNILYVKEIADSKRQRECKVIPIIREQSFQQEKMKEELSIYRQDLEFIWDKNTRYHGTTVYEGDSISKGQCGVSSLSLGNELVARGYQVLFCEGDAYFPDTPPIINHCWLKMFSDKEDIIIDLTADQSGYKDKVICENEKHLVSKGIEYKAKLENHPCDVYVDHLLDRLKYLECELQDSILE